MSREAKILFSILVVVVGGMIALFALSGSGSPAPGPKADAAKLIRAGSHKTDSGAVTVVEFGDYQCPACATAYPTTKQLMSQYAGKITFVFRNFPLSNLHKNALASAYAAEAAAKQNKFWEMHDKLYDTQTTWAETTTAADTFAGYASGLGLNLDQYKQDVAAQAIKDIVVADQKDGTDLGVQGTPTFYVNGAQAADYTAKTLTGMIDDALKSKN